MNIVKNDKVVLIKEMGNLQTVGAVFEVANITSTFVVLRDSISKVAACSVDFDDFNKHFKKLEDVKGWTKWHSIGGFDDGIIGWYRTNNKKTEVKIPDAEPNKTIRSMATCSQGDEFNLEFGVRLALMRCQRKYLNNLLNNYQVKSKEMKALLVENKNITNKMLASLYK